jgi:hypothetical protein
MVGGNCPPPLQCVALRNTSSSINTANYDSY